MHFIMNIRPYINSDAASCAKVFMAAYNRMPWNYKWKYEDAVTYLTEYADSKQFVGFVICEGDEVAGALFAHTKTWWTNNQFFIDELFVSGDKQGLGYGKLLMQKAEDYCNENSIEMITLMTNKFMPAMKFYENIDFVKVDQYIFMFKQVE
jgi:ribosomal protein S18 acetylase RimI-like enzyme